MTNELRKHFSHLWVRVKGKLNFLYGLQIVLNILHTSLTSSAGYQPSNKYRRRLLSQKYWHLRLFTPTKAASVRRQHSIATPLSRHVISKGNKGRPGAGRCPSTARRHLSDISPVLWTSSHGSKTGQEQTKLEQYSIRGPQTIVTLQTQIHIQILNRILIRIRTGPFERRSLKAFGAGVFRGESNALIQFTHAPRCRPRLTVLDSSGHWEKYIERNQRKLI